MKKIISIISVLAAAASLTACNGINSPAGNISDNSNSSQSTSSTQSSMSSQSSSSASDNSIEESSFETPSSNDDISNEHIENLKFDFTEDDLWLQSFLKENWSMAYFLLRTYGDAIYDTDYEVNTDAEHKLRYILRCDKIDRLYYIVPNPYFNDAEEYLALCDKYFSSDVLNVFIPHADIVDLENDYISIREDYEYNPMLIEINGRLYHVACAMGSGYPPCLDMAKVITKTDKEIVFSYLCCVDGLGNVDAGKGVLKNENGVWKFGWFDLHLPIDMLDIHEVWGI